MRQKIRELQKAEERKNTGPIKKVGLIKTTEKRLINHLALLLCLVFLPSVAAATESSVLAKLLENNRNIEGYFQQITYDESGVEQQSSAGEFTLAQPNRFVWNTTKPFPQRIISNGKAITIWDVDLEQATRKPFQKAVGNSPAALLSQPANEVLPHYTVNQVTSGEFELTPKATEGLFASLTLEFRKNTIRSMRISDTLGQVTVIDFERLKHHKGVDETVFEIQLPAEVDLIVEGQ